MHSTTSSLAARRAFTLMEVSMSLVLFGVLMVGVLQTLTGVQDFTRSDSIDNEMTLESRQVIEQLVSDVGNSAWFVPVPTSEPAKTAFLNQLGTPASDRSLRYYPYVIVQSASGLPATSQFLAWKRASANVVDLSASRFASLPAAHRLASQEVVFFKVRRSADAGSPTSASTERVNFNVNASTGAAVADWRTGVLPMSDFEQGVLVHSLKIHADPTTPNVVQDIPLIMESFTPAPAGLDYTNPDHLREYSYAVLPNTRTGKGQLVRQYRNGATGTITTDRVLSENVDRLVIDTYRTASTLNVNQVRITVYMSKASDRLDAQYRTARVEVTVALRSTVDPEYSLNLGSWLGSAGSVNMGSYY